MKKIWVDADPGVDDTFALAMLFEAQDQVEMMGISTVFGNADTAQTTRNAKILFEAAGKAELPVARGAYQPLVVPLDTSPYVHGKNGLGDMILPEPAMPESTRRGPEAIIDIILAHPHEITLLLIGPLTNAAIALMLEPSIVDLVKEVVIMGGAVHCPGNITPAAEANFYHDPHAAQIVMRAGWPISLASLDVSNRGFVPQNLLDKVCAADKALTPFIAGALPFYQKFLENLEIYGEVDFPDALAAAYLLLPEVFTIEDTLLYVETTGACMGQSVAVPTGKWYQDVLDSRTFAADRSISPARVMVDVDRDAFVGLIEDLLA